MNILITREIKSNLNKKANKLSAQFAKSLADEMKRVYNPDQPIQIKAMIVWDEKTDEFTFEAIHESN